jgi:hypothetical protein
MSESAQLGLLQLLATNVVELTFVRRHSKAGFPPSRRMFCTNSKSLLNSIAGKITLKFEPPKGVGLPYIPAMKGLVVTWDILMQDYRQIPLESVRVIGVYPVGNEKEIDEFWEFFMKIIHPMSSGQKTTFMKK